MKVFCGLGVLGGDWCYLKGIWVCVIMYAEKCFI